jgi:hypothetical protein
MPRYSIRRLGCEYIVLAGDQGILRIASRRQAAKVVADAEELLSVQSDLSEQPAQSPVRARKVS